MSDLTIQEAKDQKQQLERTLAELLQNFTQDTGLHVDAVDLLPVKNHADVTVSYVVRLETDI